jgi:hypothetical protein
MKRSGIVFVLLLAITLATLALAEQRSFAVSRAPDSRTGKITGIVVDKNDARILGARIEIKNERTSRVLLSDDDGRFEAELPSGTYRITVWMDGFKRFDLSAVRLKPGARARLSVRMQLQPPQSTLKID